MAWGAAFAMPADVRTYFDTDWQAITVRNINVVFIWRIVNFYPWKILFCTDPYNVFRRYPLRTGVAQSLLILLRAVLPGVCGFVPGGRKRGVCSSNCPLWPNHPAIQWMDTSGSFFWSEVAGAQSWQLTYFLCKISNPDSTVVHEVIQSLQRLRCQCWCNAVWMHFVRNRMPSATKYSTHVTVAFVTQM